VAQLLTESALLALAGGALGVLLAFWLLPALVALNPIQATGLAHYLTDFRLDGRVLFFSLGVTLLTGGIFGLFPALDVAGRDSVMAVLKQRDQRTGAGTRTRPLAALVVSEVAVAATLLV